MFNKTTTDILHKFITEFSLFSQTFHSVCEPGFQLFNKVFKTYVKV